METFVLEHGKRLEVLCTVSTGKKSSLKVISQYNLASLIKSASFFTLIAYGDPALIGYLPGCQMTGELHPGDMETLWHGGYTFKAPVRLW